MDSATSIVMEVRKRRLQDTVAVVASLQLLLALKRRKRFSRKATIERPLRQDVTFTNICSVYTDSMFRTAFHMSRKVFLKLLSMIESKLKRDEIMGRRSHRTVIAPDMRLGITIRILSGANYVDTMGMFRVGSATVYRVFHDTCDALMDHLFLPGLPRTRYELRQSSYKFKTSRENRPSPFTGCVGALDGICVKIKKPDNDLNPAAFYCRKGYYSLPVQALVDSEYRFLSFPARCVGSTHDSLAHSVSSLGRYLAEGLLQEEFFIIGDEAYVCTESLIKPVPSSQADEVDDAFNFYLSSLRIHVERAFGMLVAHWRILKVGLEFSVERDTRIICLAMKIHNFCVENGETPTHRTFGSEQRALLLAESEKWYEDCKKDDIERDTVGRNTGRAAISVKRERLIDIVRERGLTRPRVRRSTRND